MGQYFVIASLTAREFIKLPYSGAKAAEKLGESFNEGVSEAMALMYLIAPPTQLSGSDLKEHEGMGRWHGHRILMAGDYAGTGSAEKDLDDLPDDIAHPSHIFSLCMRGPAKRIARSGTIELTMPNEERTVVKYSTEDLWLDVSEVVIHGLASEGYKFEYDWKSEG